MPAFNPKKFDQQIKIEIDAVEKQLKETVYEVLDYAMRMLALNYSPIWSGSYVLSHRVGINRKNDSGPTIKNIPGVIGQKVSLSEATAYRQKAALRVKNRLKIAQIGNEGTVVIYNESAHAALVEMLPDKYMAGTMAPYFPYLKTNSVLRAELPAIIKRVERKYKK
jgi:hypothetical protein